MRFKSYDAVNNDLYFFFFYNVYNTVLYYSVQGILQHVNITFLVLLLEVIQPVVAVHDCITKKYSPLLLSFLGNKFQPEPNVLQVWNGPVRSEHAHNIHAATICNQPPGVTEQKWSHNMIQTALFA